MSSIVSKNRQSRFKFISWSHIKKFFEMPSILLPNCIHDIYFVGHKNILPHYLIINQRAYVWFPSIPLGFQSIFHYVIVSLFIQIVDIE